MAELEQLIDAHIEIEVEKKSSKISEGIYEKVLERVLKDIKLPRRIVVKSMGGQKHSAHLTHEMTEEILQYINARIPLLLVGHAGSGKTHIAIQCAKLLGLRFFSISVNEQTSKSDFLGYNDANGNLVETNFRKAYEHGGMFIIDEVDAGNPNILTVINSALSNELCPFPDGMVNRHKDFACVCTANTFGEGESIQYIGRNILDSATKDRFASVFVDYSDVIEKELSPTFVGLLKELRTHFKKNNVNIVVSTRAGIRLETIKAVKEKITKDDIVNCLNLHQEILRDAKVGSIISGYAIA